MKLLLLFAAVAFAKSPFWFDEHLNIMAVEVPTGLPVEGAPRHVQPADSWETGLRRYVDGEIDFSTKIYIPKSERLQMARQLAQQAKTVEFCTINPYLTGRYSIIPGIDDNSDALKLTLRQIPIQEMLHAGLATNLAISIGGTALFYTGQENQCQYNFPLIDFFNDCDVRDLELTSADAMQWHQYFRVESEKCKILIDADQGTFVYSSISGLYRDLDRLLIELEQEANQAGTSIFLADDSDDQTGRQMHPDTSYFFQEVTLQLSTDLSSALNLTNVITLQGEGGGIPQDNIMGPAHAELFFMGQVMAEGNGVHLWEFGPQGTALQNELNKALFDSFNVAYSLLMLTLEKIFMVNENTPEGMELKGMLMSNENNAPSNLQVMMSPTLAALGELMGSRGVHPGFRHFQFAEEPTPKHQLLKSLEFAKDFAVAEGDLAAFQIISEVISQITENFLVDFPLHGL